MTQQSLEEQFYEIALKTGKYLLNAIELSDTPKKDKFSAYVYILSILIIDEILSTAETKEDMMTKRQYVLDYINLSTEETYQEKLDS